MKGMWIWEDDNRRVNDWVVFEKKFTVSEPDPGAVLQISAETKYELWVNGRLTVMDGGLYRESTPGNGYYDEIPLEGIHSGENRLVFLVWFHGNEGRCSVTTGRAGLCFSCERYGFASDSSTLCVRECAYGETGEPLPSYLYGGYNIGYRAEKARFHMDTLEISGLHPAAEFGAFGCTPWGGAVRRPVPQIAFGEIVRAPYEKTGPESYTVTLPRCVQVNPWFEVEAAGGEVLDIRSDRYAVPGGPGDNKNHYLGQRTEYVCCPGIQRFESFNWQSAEKLIFAVPDGVKIRALGYRISRYDTELRIPVVEDPGLQTLLEKCVCTLEICMRDNFMDCPDRERGQWIGDVSVQASQVFYAGDQNAQKLLRKAIHDFISLRKGDRLVGNVPGCHYGELPGQSLCAISRIGMLAEYFDRVSDPELAELCYQPVLRYLKLWKTDERGLVQERRGEWAWHDHLNNVDHPVLENCWYYSALGFALRLSELAGDPEDREFLEERMASIAAAFQQVFWKGDRFASDDRMCDERANAMAVLSGLAGTDKNWELRDLMVSTMNCTPYFEYFVLSALCEMGCKEDAMYRMMTRYRGQILSENSTVWEDFHILGTRNHAWSGGPLTIVCRYFPELIKGWKPLNPEPLR